jgi:hypothetical protein
MSTANLQQEQELFLARIGFADMRQFCNPAMNVTPLSAKDLDKRDHEKGRRKRRPKQ